MRNLCRYYRKTRQNSRLALGYEGLRGTLTRYSGIGRVNALGYADGKHHSTGFMLHWG